MKIEELAEELDLKSSYLLKHWAEVKKRYEKYNITLEKRGRGKTSDFGIKSWGDEEIRWIKKEGL